ncbi:MAG: NAD(P)H-hydrate dehydratase [Clostridia bacterium]|nr:NAD(P)H-hydrate dehydratase [Clostridia bacterium]
MIRVVSVENMRKSDAATIAAGTPGKELMLRAGRGVFDSAQWKPPVAILCGSGNNAGDGYVIALLLHEALIPCELILLSEKFSEDGMYYFTQCREAGIPVRLWESRTDLSGYGTIADCLFGTGFRGEVRGPAREVIEAVNSSGAYVVAVDINSGLNGDSGLADLCVRSDLTVSIGDFKAGHFLNMAKDVMKKKVNIDIGIEPVDRTFTLVEQADLAGLFAARKNFSNKGTYGYTALIGGSKKYSGAIRLAGLAGAAMRSGAGVVKLAVPDVLFPIVAPVVLESTVFPLDDDGNEIVFSEKKTAELVSNVKTAAFGMGIGTGKGAADMLEYLLGHFTGRLVVDADGLTLLSRMDRARIRNAACTLVLTPHVKEFSRLTGLTAEEILNSPVSTAEVYAKETGVILLLKGPATVITDGETTYITDTGCAGMATAGSGDVLSGILAAVLGYAPDPLFGTAAAAWINGRAGELAQEKYGDISMIASDTVNSIAETLRSISAME